jgi:hypothetical protein
MTRHVVRLVLAVSALLLAGVVAPDSAQAICVGPSGPDGNPLQGCYDPPPPPPPPPPGTPDHAAYGWHGEITSDGYARGWACDPNDFNYPIFVHFYANDGNGNHIYIGQTQAGGWWNEGVAGACGGNPWHGYSFRIPDSVRNGIGYHLYAYAINICGSSCYQGNPQQQGTPVLFGYGVPAGWYDTSQSSLTGYSDTSQWLANDSACGPVFAYKYSKTITRSRSYGLWNRKLKLYMVWCANPSRTRIVGYTASILTEGGAWCSNSSDPQATRSDGGVTHPYVEIFAVAYVHCASVPFYFPRLNDTLWFRVRFFPDRRYQVVAHDS